MFLREVETVNDFVSVNDVATSSMADRITNEFLPHAGRFLVSVIVAIIIFVVGRKLIRFALRLIEKAFEKGHLEDGISKFLLSVIKFVAYCMLILIVVETVGVQTSSVIGIISSITLAIGLSFQGSLSNIAGGVLIIVFKPFTVGDYISASDVEGTVETIDILYTKLHTPDNKIVTIPNGTLANSVIVNVRKEETRRLDISIGISYESDIKKAKDILFSIVNDSAYVLKDRDIKVIVTELAASSVDLQVRVWVKKEDYWNAKYYFLEKFKCAFDEKGIVIPYGQLDVHIKQDN